MDELFLVAAIAGRAVAIPSDMVDSVIDLGAIVPVPGAPRHIVGLTALRSRVVTVIDAAASLGVESPRRAAGRAVVTTVSGHVYAILVDRLDDVAAFTRQPLANGVRLDSGWARAARGIVSRDGEGVLVIDPAELVRGAGDKIPAAVAA